MTWTQRRKAKIPPTNIIEQELNVPVEIIISDIDPAKPAIQILQELIDLTRSAIEILYLGAGMNVD